MPGQERHLRRFCFPSADGDTSRFGNGDLLPKQYLTHCRCDACYRVLSDERLANAILEILAHPQRRDIVASARLYYRKWPRMAELYQL